MVNIFLDGKEIKGLWDTGAMVNLINIDFMRREFPDVKMYSMEEFMGEKVILSAANKSQLSVKGFAIFEFGVSETQKLFQIPFW